MGMGSALLHRARIRQVHVAGEPDMLGERARQVVDGPWFKARLLEPRGGGVDQRTPESGVARTRVQYELLADFVAADGSEVVLEPDMQVLVVAFVLTGPEGFLLSIDGKPEFLNDGRKRIGWDARAIRVDRGA